MTETPETFQERREAFLGLMQKVAKWPHCRHTREDVEAMESINKYVGGVNDFEDAIESAILNPSIHSAAPAVLMSSHPNTRTGGYGWQMMTAEFKHVCWHAEEPARGRLKGLQEKLSTGDGMPSATDGSKGQWRSALISRMRLLKWLLGELPNGVRMCEGGCRAYESEECSRHPKAEIHVVSAKDYFDDEIPNEELTA